MELEVCQDNFYSFKLIGMMPNYGKMIWNKFKKSSIIGQDQENVNICFCVIFDYYNWNFIPEKDSGDLALSLPSFEISLVFPNFLSL